MSRPKAIAGRKVLLSAHNNLAALVTRSTLTVKFRIDSRLTVNDYLREVHFITFVLYGCLDSRAQCLFVRILGHIAMPVNHLFASFDSNEPLRLVRVPRDFHTLRTHGLLRPQSPRHSL